MSRNGAGTERGVEPTQILLVDDDEALCHLLSLVLDSEGYGVRVAGTADEAFAQLGEAPDLVVLDVMLGESDGRAVLAEIRRRGDLPVIMVSGQGDSADRVLALRLGADDFLTKPFSPVELVARVETVLRRSRGAPASGRWRRHHDAPAAKETLRLDEGTREVWVLDRQVHLTAREFDLLAYLARSPRQVFTRAQILQHVWESSPGWQQEATVTEHVRRIRSKLETDPDHPRWITTVRGVGYRFEP